MYITSPLAHFHLSSLGSSLAEILAYGHLFNSGYFTILGYIILLAIGAIHPAISSG
jgi:hypothetical protein